MSTKAISHLVTGTRLDDMPTEVVDKMRLAILDHIGVILAARDDKAVAAVTKVAERMGGRKESTVFSTGQKSPCNVAAMVNAVMAATLDMDDGAFRSIGHLAHAGRVIVPSCLAVAEAQKTTGAELIEATAVAYEVCLRFAWAIRLWDKNAVTEFVGGYGAAAGAARLLGLSLPETIHALGIAEAHCLQHSRARFLRKAAMTKDAAGWAAMTGVTAALLAQAGFHGPATVFDLPESEGALAGLGREWELMRLYFKPYSSCRNNHGAIDGVLGIMQRRGLNPDDIKKITVGVASSPAGKTAYYRPLTTWEAQFSIPYCVGAAVADGDVGPDQIAPHRLNDHNILNQTDKVKVVVDPGADLMWPGELPGRVKIETKSGRVFSAWVPHPLGSPENPLTHEGLHAKFVRLAARSLGSRRAVSLCDNLEKLAVLKDVRQLVARLQVNDRCKPSVSSH